MTTPRFHRFLIASIVAPLTLFASSALAQDASDTIAGAPAIAATPFTATTDVSGATSTADEPNQPPCTFATVEGSVWYRYSPAADAALVAATTGSTYDTVVIVWDGAPDVGSIVGCNDDAGGLQSRAPFTAEAGHSYYIQIASWRDLPPPDASLTFSLGPPPPPLVADVRIDPVGRAAGATGVVELRGTIACNRPAFATVVLHAQQQHGRVAAGALFLQGTCGPQPAQIVVRLVGANARFTPGPITVTLAGSAAEGPFGGEAAGIYVTGTVRLHGASTKEVFLPPPPPAP